MLERLSNTLKKYVNGWLVLLFFAAEMLFNIVILPDRRAKIEAASGGTGPIDLQFFYTPDKVYSMVAAYGDAGRADYRAFELTGDILYPIVYTLFFALLITWLFQRGFPPDSRMQKLNVLPFGMWFFDLLENVGIVSMLLMYPSRPAILAWLTMLFGSLKWGSFLVTIALVLVGLVKAAVNRFRKQA